MKTKTKNLNRSLATAFSFAFVLGTVSFMVPEKLEASGLSSAIKKAENEMSDMDYANKYIRKHPETGDYFKELDQEFREKKKNARSYREMKSIENEYREDKKNLVLMFANLERKDQRIKELKNRDYSQSPGSGEPRGMREARRLAATCGRGETVGYSNYFGDPSFYNELYPLVGPEFAEIEAITVLRDEFLPKINSRVMKFISDNQINLTMDAFVNSRGDKYSSYHMEGGQQDYVNKMTKQSQSMHAKRDDQLSNDMFRDLHSRLESFDYRFLVSKSMGRDGNRYETKTGADILAECRYFWAKGNTVRDYDPSRSVGYNNMTNSRIGIQPNFNVAPPVKPMGTPAAKQNLNQAQFEKKTEVKGLDQRMKQYNDRLGTEDRNESADDIIKNTYGDDFKDPSSFKKIEGGMDVNNGDRSRYQKNRDQQARENAQNGVSGSIGKTQEKFIIQGSMVNQFNDQEARRQKETKKLNFNDIYN